MLRKHRKIATLPRWRLTLDGEIALGPGKADLLAAIARAGSISGAARALGMSYRRAWTLVATMNQCFALPLVETTAWRRGGARLTAEGEIILRLYRDLGSRSLAATRAPRAALVCRLRRRRPAFAARPRRGRGES